MTCILNSRFWFQMERSPVITWLFHLRVGTLLALLFIINVTMFQYAYSSTVAKGASVQLVFGFEYAVLLTVVLNITIKYILHTIDLQSENPWDNKPVFLLYTELIIGLMKVKCQNWIPVTTGNKLCSVSVISNLLESFF